MELQKLHIEATLKTPQVDFDPETGDLLLKGKSIPENAAKVYESLLKWVNVYKNNPKFRTNLILELDYFNTASTIWIAKLVQSLSNIKDKSCTLMIHLYFGLEDFDELLSGDINDELHPIIHLINDTVINVGIKIYGTSEDGMILKESMVLF